MATLAYETQQPDAVPGMQVLEVKITGAATETSGTATFPKAFSAAPKVIGISRVDAVANARFIARISTLSTTGLVATYDAALTGSEVFYIYVRGNIAAST